MPTARASSIPGTRLWRPWTDLKGLKLRGTGTSGLVQAALGASPVGKSMRECYQMLQKGVVDGSSHPIESNKGWKLGGGGPLHDPELFSTAYTTTFAVFMNKDKWAKLTPEQQKVITDLSREYAIKHAKAWDASDAMRAWPFSRKRAAKSLPSQMRKPQNGRLPRPRS